MADKMCGLLPWDVDAIGGGQGVASVATYGWRGR
jgi:hypothetical protein